VDLIVRVGSSPTPGTKWDEISFSTKSLEESYSYLELNYIYMGSGLILNII